ncbi:hypothetical protein D3C80_1851080 [compost metagenome]
MRVNGLTELFSECISEYREGSENGKWVFGFFGPSIQLGFDLRCHFVESCISLFIHGFKAGNARCACQWVAMMGA